MNSVASFVYWCRSPYTKRVPSTSVASRTWKPLRRRTVRTVSARNAVHRRAIGEARVEVGLGLGDTDVADAAPELRRTVERAHDDRDDEHDQPRTEPRRAEDREQREPLHDVDDARAQDRVVAGVQVVQRRRVVRRRTEGEVGKLLDRHPHDREQRQEGDLEDGEVDGGEQVPQPVAETGRDVPIGRSGRGRRDDRRARDGSGS